LLGTIDAKQALLTLERAAFTSDPAQVNNMLSSLTNLTNLGANDIYRWYMSNTTPTQPTPNLTTASSNPIDANPLSYPPDIKLNLIYPCTPKHISKYSTQRFRFVTESPTIYITHIRPWILSQRTSGRLDWIFNILSGLTEQEDVILRSDWGTESGFLLLPDLNWDRKTITSLHLLALVERRDIWSLRDLKKKHIPWLRHLHEKVRNAATKVFPGQVEEDELKCYVHYHPTYYHFHVHVVHVMMEPEGGTQNVGKAWELGGLVEWLESMEGDEQKGFESVSVGYGVGEESELWKELWGEMKVGQEVTLGKSR
jgi:m7GpppX diphosphatase